MSYEVVNISLWLKSLNENVFSMVMSIQYIVYKDVFLNVNLEPLNYSEITIKNVKYPRKMHVILWYYCIDNNVFTSVFQNF